MNKSYFNSIKNTLLSSKPSTAIRLLLMVLFVSSFANAATITSTQSGNWNATTTWVGGVVPSSGDAVIIAANHTVTVNGTYTCASIALGTNNNVATITFSAATSQLTVNGLVTLGNAGNNNRRGSLNMTNGGILNCQGFAIANTGANVFTPGSGTVVLTATNTLPNTKFTSFNNLTINFVKL